VSALVTAEGAGFALRGLPLLHPTDLALEPGCLLVVVGPNGAGKSTLLKLLSGHLTPTSGIVRLDGRLLADHGAAALALRRAVMAQASALSFAFPVHHVVELGLSGISTRLTRATRRALVEQALAQARVGHLAGRILPTLSGGEQQRVHFARALAQLMGARAAGGDARQALFLDEPVASLDLNHQLGLMDEARRLAREGLAVFAILHDLNLAATYADEIAVMAGGRILHRGAPSAVLTAPVLREAFGLDLEIGQAAGLPVILPQLRNPVRIAG
jgi:iron complex transport system ATP-binding protein